jgi:hypothetical protein
MPAAISHAIHKGQNFCDGAVEVFRNLPPHFDQLVQGPGHQFVFHDHDPVLTTDFPDLFGDEAGAFRDHDGRSHCFRIVFQCHRQVSRVRDDDIRLGHGGHHALA